MNSYKQTGSTLQRDAADRPGGPGSLRARSPSARLRAIAGVTGVV
jgi:hypothetical protein